MDIPSSFPPPGTPLPVPPISNPIVAKAVPTVPVSMPLNGKYVVMRGSGDKVCLLRQGKRHWITSPEKLSELEYTFADVVRVPDDEFNFYPEGESI